MESKPTRFIDQLRSALERFVDAQEAIRELAVFATEHVAPLDKAVAAVPRLANITGDLDPEQIAQAASAVDLFMDELVDTVKTHRKDRDSTDPGTPQEDSLPEEAFQAVTRVAEKFGQAFAEAVPEGPDRSKWLLALFKHRSRRPRLSVVLSSLLTSAVGDFEVLFAAVVRNYYKAYPGALKSDEDKFSYSDVCGYESLDEFRAWYVDKRVESLLRLSMDEWYDWLARRMGVKAPVPPVRMPKLREILQRRHAIVHNGGRVSRQYLLKTGLEHPPDLNSELIVDVNYLLEATEALTTAGVLTVLEAMWKVAKSKEDYAAIDVQLHTLVYELLRSGRVQAVIGICEQTLTRPRDERTRLALKVNAWVARKRLEGVESIREEVVQWQTSALKEEFTLAKHALLDENATALEIAAKLISRQELSPDALQEWPLLEGVRQYSLEIERDVASSEGVASSSP